MGLPSVRMGGRIEDSRTWGSNATGKRFLRHVNKPRGRTAHSRRPTAEPVRLRATCGRNEMRWRSSAGRTARPETRAGWMERLERRVLFSAIELPNDADTQLLLRFDGTADGVAGESPIA